jgi:hypothetical protein
MHSLAIIGLLAALALVGLPIWHAATKANHNKTHAKPTEPLPGLCFSNIGEGTHDGEVSRFADTGGVVRFMFAKEGTTAGQTAAIADGTHSILGVFLDETPSTGADAALPMSIALLGARRDTLKCAINSTVTVGDLIGVDSGGYGVTISLAPTGGTPARKYIAGKALRSGVAGDTIEFDPRPFDPTVLPAPGTVTQTQNSITDNSGGTAATPSAGVRTVAAVVAANTDTSAAALVSTKNAIADLAAELNLVKADVAAIKTALAL